MKTMSIFAAIICRLRPFPADFRRRNDFLGKTVWMLAALSESWYCTQTQSPTQGISIVDSVAFMKVPVALAGTSPCSFLMIHWPRSTAVTRAIRCWGAQSPRARSWNQWSIPSLINSIEILFNFRSKFSASFSKWMVTFRGEQSRLSVGEPSGVGVREGGKKMLFPDYLKTVPLQVKSRAVPSFSASCVLLLRVFSFCDQAWLEFLNKTTPAAALRLYQCIC